MIFGPFEPIFDPLRGFSVKITFLTCLSFEGIKTLSQEIKMPYFPFKYNWFSPRSICPLSRCTRCQGGCSPPPPSPPSPPPSPSCSPRQQTWFLNSKRERQTVKVAAKAPLCAASSFNESGLWNQGILSEKITLSWLVIGHLRVFRPFFIRSAISEGADRICEFLCSMSTC